MTNLPPIGRRWGMRTARGRSRKRRASVLGAALIALLVGGCTGGDEDSTPTPAPPTTVAESMDAPTPTPKGPAEPTLPAAAEGSSVRAGQAFVNYYVAVLNYSFVTGNVRILDRISTGDCSGCGDYVDFVTKLYDAGGWYRSKGWVIRRVIPSARPNDALVFTVLGETSRASFKLRDSAKPKVSDPEDLHFTVEVRNGVGSWQVASIIPVT